MDNSIYICTGIKECEVIQWFVEPGARIEEFDPICEVQSDKASVEITSRYNGVVKTLHYDVGQMALVGKVSDHNDSPHIQLPSIVA
jgi:pyruvate/2-oxoglutarate dehydrogenase complex dihydrolipoamide acyltransferase (E2) component